VQRIIYRIILLQSATSDIGFKTWSWQGWGPWGLSLCSRTPQGQKFCSLGLEASLSWPRGGPALALKAAGLDLVHEVPFAAKYYIIFFW